MCSAAPRHRRSGVQGAPLGLSTASWESTAEYYRLANALVAEQLGGLHPADLVLRSLDFAAIATLQRRGAWSEAAVAAAPG